MLQDMVLQRARVIAVLEAAGHANRGDHSPVYSGCGAELRSGIAGLRSGIAAALRAGGLEAHELDNLDLRPAGGMERAVSAGYAAALVSVNHNLAGLARVSVGAQGAQLQQDGLALAGCGRSTKEGQHPEGRHGAPRPDRGARLPAPW